MKINQTDFLAAITAVGTKTKALQKYIKATHGIKITTTPIFNRVGRLREKGLLPLASGNQVNPGEVLKGTSTLYDEEGNVKIQWVKTNVALTNQLTAMSQAIEEMAFEVEGKHTPTKGPILASGNTTTMYISNDVHFGALMWAPESGTDWDLAIAENTVRESYDYLFATSPASSTAIVVDLGDLIEADDFKNMTPHSGNVLAVDGRYPKVMKAAYMSLIYAIDKALLKHQYVHFINISGNHDLTTGHGIREIIAAWYRNEPRVLINREPSAIKYHLFGKNLFMFAHGDGLKMQHAGEAMAADRPKDFAVTDHRFAHFGHNHKDSVYDGRICKSESHRNLAPLNDWAFHKGFRRQLGTMKSITYHNDRGEISRNTYNISVPNEVK